jgi:hypothetical protein
MPKIDLATLPEFQGLTIVVTEQELKEFLAKLRQDYYSPAKLKKLHLSHQLNNWLKSSKPNSVTFFAIYDEPDDLAKNDNWGHYGLLKCIAVRSPDNKVHVFKTLIEKFVH